MGSAPSGSTGCQSATGGIRDGEPVFFGSPGEKLLESSEPKCPCKAVGDVVELPLPRRSGFQSALLAGGLETAAPCVGASRPHSPLTAHRYATGAAEELAEALVAG